MKPPAGVACRILLGVACAVAALGMSSSAEADPGCSVKPAKGVPADAYPSKLTETYWLGRVRQQEQDLERMDTSKVRMLLLGDSLIEAWAPPVLQQFYGHRSMLNLGISGDSTQGLLWRLGRLRLTNLRPRLIVLLIGTNNVWPNKAPEDVAAGVAEVVRQIRDWTPQSRILLIGLLPRGADPADPVRRVVQQVNTIIARCADGVSVIYNNPGTMLVDADGRLSDKIVPDHLHPNWIGYGILSAALEPQIRHLLGEAAN